MKILRNICLVLLGAGILLCIGGAACGGTVYASWWDGGIHTWREALDAARGYVLREWYDGDGYHRGWFHRDDDWFDVEEPWPGAAGYDSLDALSDWEELTVYPMPESGVHSFDIELEGGGIVLETGDALALRADAGAIDAEIDDGELKLSVADGARAPKPRVYLALPAGVSYEEIDIQAAGGVISLDTLDCQGFHLDLKGGETEISSLSARETDVSMGAGDFRIYWLKSQDSNFFCGAGTGTVVFAGPQENYTLSAACGAGTLILNSQDALSGSFRQTFGSGPQDIHAEVGTGTLDFSFGT